MICHSSTAAANKKSPKQNFQGSEDCAENFVWGFFYLPPLSSGSSL
jgi:hypothetical protein